MEPRGADIGFIGLGVMGLSMAGHLARAEARLHVHTRTRDKAIPLLDAGAIWHDGPGSLAAACRAVFTMVGHPSDVEDIYFGPSGILACARPGTLLVDTTTSRPDLARRIWREAEKL
ncbi:MAG TPA: NAD(P)-binding domain-containing protein, partial [Magnetospirillaceae bacterium]|nr:NAD(P)-binding domain-containing protein [Magnetospirillaceae bacterium]